MNRNAATRLLVDRLTNEVIVSNLGQATTDLQLVSDRDLNYYTFGSMGQCSSIGMGIALARPDTKVVCLDGDGSLIMNMGMLCTVANVAPKNLCIVVWDNERHETTGGQPTATAHRSSLAQMARGAGIEKVIEPRDETELGHAFDRILSEEGPFVVPVKIRVGRSEGGLSRDVIGSARRFRQALAAVPAVR